MRRPFGNGREVSLFSLGTMRALASPDQMLSVLKAALDAGINHLETAPAYGPAERFLGQALERLEEEGLGPAEGWVITSKLLPGISLQEGQRQLRRSFSGSAEANSTTSLSMGSIGPPTSNGPCMEKAQHFWTGPCKADWWSRLDSAATAARS